ncbi:MAG: CDP-diacylglycerol--glycerol-3-phosphate 3-phosphatidyltransferase [Melioribacteraceae bacterium]
MLLPNQLTVLRIILTPIFIVLFLSNEPLLIQISLGVFLIAALTDWYDGWLARKFNYITEWGKFMDPLADKILTSTAFFGFVSIGMLQFWMVLLIVLRDFLITLLRAYADYRRVSFTTSTLAKWKTFAQMFFLYYLLILYTLRTVPSLSIGYDNWFTVLLNQEMIFWIMLSVTLFTVVTGITYLYSNRFLIKQLFTRAN